MLSRTFLRNLVCVTTVALCLGYGVRTAQRFATAAGQTAEKTEAAAADKAVQEQDAQDEPSIEPLDIPEGDADELFEFVEKLLSEENEASSEEEQRNHVLRVLTTQIAVADKILAQKDLEDDDTEKAAQMKIQGHVNLAVVGVPKASQRAVAAIDSLANDPRPILKQFAKNNNQIVRIICIGGLSPEDRDELMTEVLDELQKRKFAQRVLQRAQELGQALEDAGDRERVISFYSKLAEGMIASDNENLISQAKRIEGQLRRFKLPGNFLELEGTTLAGKPFDWESYRGKVVLVDYWATWCGPCLAELPNVKTNYKKYRKQGFEVVGISLDDDQEQLEEFIKDEKIPWVTLFEPEAEQRGWETPLAIKYGITGIPMAILVDKDGKVVSMAARGEELSRLLDEMFGDKE